MSAEEQVAQAYAVPCEWCGAAVGEECHTAMRTIDRTGRPHQIRLDAAARARRRGELPDAVQPRFL